MDDVNFLNLVLGGIGLLYVAFSVGGCCLGTAFMPSHHHGVHSLWISRSENPVEFWLAVSLEMALGVFLLGWPYWGESVLQLAGN